MTVVQFLLYKDYANTESVMVGGLPSQKGNNSGDLQLTNNHEITVELL